MNSLILASGFGTRLYPLGVGKAKGLIQYKGKALLRHIVDKIPPSMDILVNTNQKFEPDFRRWQKTIGSKVELCIEPVLTEDQTFGAVGSLNYWIRGKNIVDDLLVIASDNYFEFDLAEFIAAYNGKNPLVAVYDIGDKSTASRFGVAELDGHKIIGLEEKPAQPKTSFVAIACYILPPRIFPILAQYCAEGRKDNLGNFIAHLVERDEVHAYVFNELWFDVGSIDVYKQLRRTSQEENQNSPVEEKTAAWLDAHPGLNLPRGRN